MAKSKKSKVVEQVAEEVVAAPVELTPEEKQALYLQERENVLKKIDDVLREVTDADTLYRIVNDLGFICIQQVYKKKGPNFLGSILSHVVTVCQSLTNITLKDEVRNAGK